VIRTNLSTRPFYNEQAVHAWLLVLAIVVALATAFNVTRLLQYSRSDTELATAAARDEARTAELRGSAAQLRAGVDQKQVELASVEARLANDLIDRRTFSWTELFNRFETTLPDEVRITGVRPRVEDDRTIILTITVLARGVDDLDRFMRRLEDSGGFSALNSREEHINEEGQLEASLETIYAPRPASGAAKASVETPAPPAPAPGRPR
jgi:Tfp pilus assembly protein PilN